MEKVSSPYLQNFETHNVVILLQWGFLLLEDNNKLIILEKEPLHLAKRGESYAFSKFGKIHLHCCLKNLLSIMADSNGEHDFPCTFGLSFVKIKCRGDQYKMISKRTTQKSWKMSYDLEKLTFIHGSHKMTYNVQMNLNPFPSK